MKRIKSKLAAKLKSCAGESLAEVLIALLIAALALTMLATMIGSSGKLITQSRKLMDSYYEKNNALAAQTDGGELEISMTDAADSAAVLLRGGDWTVRYYVNDAIGGTNVISYALDTTMGEGGGGE